MNSQGHDDGDNAFDLMGKSWVKMFSTLPLHLPMETAERKAVSFSRPLSRIYALESVWTDILQ